MIHIDKEVTIRRRAEEVFSFVANPRNIPKWRADVESVDFDGGPDIGAKFREKVTNFGTFEMEIIRYQPSDILVIKAIAGPGARPKQFFTFIRAGSSTIVSAHIDLELRGIFKLARPLLKPAIKKNWSNYLKELKKILEK